MSRQSHLFAIVPVVLTGVLAACSPDQQPPPTPTKTPAPLVAANPTLAQGPTVTPAPFATPTPEIIAVGPDNFPQNVNPLTGLEVDDRALLDKRPLAVKISNSPPEVRPQAGLNSADLVFEHYAEGGVTRFTAVFLSNTPEKVGSVRSCRLIDLEVTLMYDALWSCSGSSIGVKRELINSPNYRLMLNQDFGFGEPYFRRIPEEDKAFEHTLFAIPEEMWSWAEEQGFGQRTDLSGLAFHSQPPAGGTIATRVLVDYGGVGAHPEWNYDASNGTYLRTNEGPHLDSLTNEQVSFENMVVVAATHFLREDILEDTFGSGFCGEVRGHCSTEIQIWGQGAATLFRDGQRYEGRWSRANRNDIIVFTDLDGNTLQFKPGKTWISLVPPFFDRITVEP